MPSSVEALRFQEAVRLSEEGISLMRQNLHRHHPDESTDDIERRLVAWLIDRPMDAPGRVVTGTDR